MPSIKSDLTNQKLPASQMRSFSIPDEGTVSDAPPPRQQVFESSAREDVPLDFNAVDKLMQSRGMPPVNRADLSSQYNQQQQAKRGFSPQMNQAQDTIDYEQQVKEARQAKMTGKERLTPGAKQRIEMLCGISRMQRPVDLDGQQYILQTLKGKEQREVWVAAAECEGTVHFPFELRKQTLARSLIQVGGTDIQLFLGTNDIEARLELVEELPEEVLNKLYHEFNTLIDENKKKFSIKTDQEAGELVADLKK